MGLIKCLYVSLMHSNKRIWIYSFQSIKLADFLGVWLAKYHIYDRINEPSQQSCVRVAISRPDPARLDQATRGSTWPDLYKLYYYLQKSWPYQSDPRFWTDPCTTMLHRIVLGNVPWGVPQMTKVFFATMSYLKISRTFSGPRSLHSKVIYDIEKFMIIFSEIDKVVIP